MLTLHGVPITEDDARRLVDLLLRRGRADDLSVAATIEHGLGVQARVVALTPAERTAILGVLDDPPDGLLKLRAVLLRDRLAGWEMLPVRVHDDVCSTSTFPSCLSSAAYSCTLIESRATPAG